MAFWLMKSEPDVYGVDELERDGRTAWEGVRNYQARNFMRDDMRRGDQAFLYHSSCEVPAVVGLMEICREAYADPAQFDRRSPYYDAASRRDDPRWVTVDVRFLRRLRRPVSLSAMREAPALAGLALLRRGNRLSVMPVAAAEWEFILGME